MNAARTANPPLAAALLAVGFAAAAAPLPPSAVATQRTVLRVEGGREELLAADEAARRGYTVVSLRDDWTPYIFREPLDDKGVRLLNRYRAVYLGLAQDRTDGDGQPLPSGAKNHLELFGIPPTLSVLRARFLDDARADHQCASIDLAKIRAVPSIPSREPKNELKERLRVAALEHDLEAKRKANRLADLASLADAQPALVDNVRLIDRAHANRLAFAEVEKRLRCEGMLGPKARHAAGLFDDAMREALVRFQMKHKLYDAAALKPQTLAALGRTPLENDYDALVRVLTERVVDAANILEDGSIEGQGERQSGDRQSAANAGGGEASAKDVPTYVDAEGHRQPVRNLVAEALKATLEQLGLQNPEAALAFFRRHAETDFGWLEAAVRLPPPPPWYGPAMDLSVEIDRGDVIYDPLFDEKGRPTNQTRRHFPMLTMRVRWRDQLIPLVRWRTTIGGWRSDLASNGYEYYRYKGSDVGPRVWRNVVAGPVWIAPNSTPVRTLVKWKTVNGSSQLVVNYDEVGPGYLSAYGLVAAYNVVPGKDGKPDWDNGVRVHGSSEYLSIRNPNAYSHGCHRLMNHLAVRLFSFVLRHRNVKIIGERPLGFSRQFFWKDAAFELRLPTRGFHYELDPPLPVNVLEGNVLGKTKKPILTYMPKPDVQYPPGPPPTPPDLPESRAGGGGGAE